MEDRKTDETGSRLRELAERDDFASTIRAEFLEGGEGWARVRLRVEKRHLNFYGTCHGGVMFSLADFAFGLAGNSHGVICMAVDAHIAFCAPVAEGETLTATARELYRGKKMAAYRIEVTREDGALVNHFTGTGYITGKPAQ